MSFGMTKEGFIPKRLADVLESLHTKLANATDPATGERPFVNEEADGIIMQTVDILAEEISICWEAAYLSANQYDPLNSSGVPLRGLVQLNGITASYGAPTQLTMELRGTSGTVIPEGSIITSEDGTQAVKTTAAAIIGGSGTVQVTANYTVNGAFEPENNTIIAIQTPVFGWNGASNIGIVSVGALPDTDTELHIKQERATSATSYRQVDAIYSGIINVPGVTFARIYVNSTTSTDSRGITAKTIAPVVVGGTNENIANVLRLKSDALARFQGNTTVNYTGNFGEVQAIKFTRPTEKDVYVDIDITFTDTNLWPEDGYDRIKKAIVEYAKYNQDGTAGFPPGEDVIISRLYTPINTVLGFKINSVKIGFTSTTGTSDLTIAWNELAKFDEDNINITVTA